MEPASRPNRTTPTRDGFVRWLRGLDAIGLARFVADLHAARGRETEILDGGDVTSAANGERVVVRVPRGEHDEERTLAVVTAPPSGTLDADAVVVGRTVDDERLGDGTPIVDAAALHRMALYAVDRDRLPALLRRHFGATAFADADDGTARQRFSITLDRRRLAFAAVLVLAVVAAAAMGVSPLTRLEAGDAVGGGDAAGDGSAADDRDAAGGEDGRAAGAVWVTAASGSSGTTPELPTVGDSGTVGGGDIAVCPSPPTNVHPASFRPVPANTASAFGLDGWQLRQAENVTVYPGRTERRTPYVPEVRHKAIYEAPSGAVYVLVADRWANPTLAAEVSPVLSYPRQVAFVWGTYTFAVTGSASTGELPKATLRTAATELLAHVRSPAGTTFGEECVRRLAAAQNATADRPTDTFSTVAPDFDA